MFRPLAYLGLTSSVPAPKKDWFFTILIDGKDSGIKSPSIHTIQRALDTLNEQYDGSRKFSVRKVWAVQ